ncbi:MAG: hypothetical protein IPO68_09630 [Chitinophagaceae bacterium]|nr:hypothetical protein [Chitinophagaceae bacterium]
MPLFVLDKELTFPPVHLAEPDGLLAMGGDLSKVFFGESMFSTMSNASRFAFIKYVLQLKSEGIELIDCQVYTEYLESLGARMISGAEFDTLLKKLIP